MEAALRIDGLDVDRLLADWRWLCPHDVTIIARNAFGDLFLVNVDGKVLWLDVSLGELTEVADSVSTFRELLNDAKTREQLLAESDANGFAIRGLKPADNECIGFATPLVFAESGHANNAYIADIYDHVGFLGNLHKQISGLPKGAKVKLVVGKPPKSKD
jgi:hypothetical protein